MHLRYVQEGTRPIRRVLIHCCLFKQGCPDAAWAVWLIQLTLNRFYPLFSFPNWLITGVWKRWVGIVWDVE